MTTKSVVKAKTQKKGKLTMNNNMLGISLCEVRGLINDLMDKLCGKDGRMWLEAFKKFLRMENPFPVKVWNTWKTIKLGMFKNVEEIRQALKASGNSIGDWANDILGKPAFKVSETEQDVELVNVSVLELGFKQGACYADICKRALELGLDLCPAEVGPQLRLQWKDQPKGTCVVVAMEAITASGGDLDVFSVRCLDGGERYLDANDDRAGRVWHSSVRFLFLRRKVA
jgi:hypothetical protein